MSEGGKLLSILVAGVDQEMVERFTSEFGFSISQAETHDSLADAVEGLRGQKPYDVIITSCSEPMTDELKMLLGVCSLDHRKRTPIVMLSQ